jgi:hypothetical protein
MRQAESLNRRRLPGKTAGLWPAKRNMVMSHRLAAVEGT